MCTHLSNCICDSQLYVGKRDPGRQSKTVHRRNQPIAGPYPGRCLVKKRSIGSADQRGIGRRIHQPFYLARIAQGHLYHPALSVRVGVHQFGGIAQGGI